MNIEQLNQVRRAAGLPDLTKEQRLRLEEKFKKNEKTTILKEAANNRAGDKLLSSIAKQHCHVRSLKKTGDDNKDYHDIPCWALETALKAAYKAGFEQGQSKKPVKESVDKESGPESVEGGSNPGFDPKGGEKVYKDGKDTEEKGEKKSESKGLSKGKSPDNYNTPKNKSAKQVTEKKAEKDYDDDGKVESPEAEYKGSKDKAIKKAIKKEKNVKETYAEYEEYEEFTSAYKKGALVTYKGKKYIVHVPDAKADYVGLIPYGLKNASVDAQNAAVDLVKKKNIDPASDEDCENAEMEYQEEISKDVDDEMDMEMDDNEYGDEDTGCCCPDSSEESNDEIDYEMREGSSEGYKNPKGTNLKADSSSGATKKTGNVYKEKPHKDNSEKAESKDKGKKGLKKIGENNEFTVWGKDYNEDGRTDKDESPDQFKADDPNQRAKINVPSKYKTALKETIDNLRKESDLVRVRDPLGSEFYENAANAIENLLSHLEEGTRRSLMLAQIDMNRLMSPMVTRIPNEVYMFIVRGGKPASLSELFKEVKVKRESGADLSKEKYTK